jgi:hypothetical protein
MVLHLQSRGRERYPLHRVYYWEELLATVLVHTSMKFEWDVTMQFYDRLLIRRSECR